eukprot:XP_011426721.1 PREDICTED: uncharacterized protein LOC105327797 [Crassostrea gigas]
MSAENIEKSPKTGDSSAQGLLIALAGFACLSIGDGVIKSLAGEWPGTAVAALRYSFGALGLLVMLLAVEGRKGLRFPMAKAQLGRGISVAFATLAFFSAIFLMPLADATAIQFTSPMITALLSALILSERMPRAAWIATVVAFGGVLLVLRPSVGALGWAAILPIIAAIGISLMMVFNRMVATAGSALLMQLLISAIAAPILIVAVVLGHFSGWEPLRVPPPDWTIIARCALVAVTASFSHWLIYLATTKASAAITAPMVYIQLLIAVLIGIFFYRDYPDLLAMMGAAIIIAAGLWLWRRQARRVA